MSLRAIKKQQNNSQNIFPTTRETLFKKYNSQNQNPTKPTFKKLQTTANRVTNTKDTNVKIYKTRELVELEHQHRLLGRLTHSAPELGRNLKHETTQNLRRKSENDIIKLLAQCGNNFQVTGGLLNAQSEVCLQSISSHYYQQNDAVDSDNNNTHTNMSGARSHKDLSSNYGTPQFNQSLSVLQSSYERRMSESSLSSSAYSQQQVNNQSSQMTSMTICGYEIIEERARFTVYKLRVENQSNCWLVLRRYTDFVRLKNKLENAFPRLQLMLPRKKFFGDNFNSVFLDNRVQGLQLFVNAVMAREELRRCKIVREFFCLDEPPSYSESMEECRAIFEAQEETISHLKTQISSKNELILNLQKKLRDELLEKEKLKEVITSLTSKVCENCSENLSVDHNN